MSIMKKTIFILLISFFTISAFVSCKKEQCTNDANATITGYDQTKGLCGTGFIIKIHAQNNVAEKEYIVRDLTGKYAEQITLNSKFPIKIRYQGKLEPIENCPNVIASLEVFEPIVSCSK